MASNAINFTYKYLYDSNLNTHKDTKSTFFGLDLATCNANHNHPYFFKGELSKPRLGAQLLLILSEIVRTHYFLPIPPNVLDPVVTSNDGVLRLEGFSACCGIYARVDLTSAFFKTEIEGRGTTNVDFNDPMRNALRRVRDNDEIKIAVGKQEFTLERKRGKENESIVEKKVKLPLRWIKGFSEVQSFQPDLMLKIKCSANEALRLVRSIPKTSPKQPSYITKRGNSLRLSQRPAEDAIRISGLHRLKVIEPLICYAQTIKIWSNDKNTLCAWDIEYENVRFFLLLSPEIYRGFSGEGQILESLATNCWQTTIAKVRAQLNWQNQIDVNALSNTLNLNENDTIAALTALGANGLAGFDVSTGHYFHRELPFDLDKIESLQPRLINARKLVSNKKIKLNKRLNETEADYLVKGNDVEHFVQIREDSDKCTCPWFNKYQGERGPCKHILASNILFDENKK